MKIKKISELFDTEELKGQYEIPYLSGELIGSLKKIDLDKESPMNKVFWKYPLLERFNKDSLKYGDINIDVIYATSKNPVEDTEFYVQFTLGKSEDEYLASVCLRRMDDDDESNWVFREFFLETIDEVFDIAGKFLKSCRELGVVDDEDLQDLKNFNLSRFN